MSLLATKLFIPQTIADLVPRPRLLKRLSDGLRFPVVLISAPAGSGKTTLLSEWRSTNGGRLYPLVWLSLEDDDNDPARFMIYFAAAVDPLKPGLGENAIVLLQSPQSWKTVITAIINGLSSLKDDFAVVLDDYHLITDPTIHEAVAFLIDHMPPQMHLILTSDLPLTLSRQRARGKVFEIGAKDLRFTSDETGQFLRQSMQQTFTAAEINAIDQRTEGWVGGVRLAALAMRQHHDTSKFISTFTASTRPVIEDLVEEILNCQPEQMRQFLLKTSVLDYLSASLCYAVSGQPIFQRLVDVFIEPLDNEREWYRYHPLFVDALRQQLHRAHPEWIETLHHAASLWYEKHAIIHKAIHHSLLSQDFKRSALLIDSMARKLIAVSELSTLRRWLGALPEEVISRKPALSIAYAWILGLNQQGEKHLLNALQALETPNGLHPKERGRLLAEAKTLQASAALNRQDYTQSILFSQQALQYSDEMRSMNNYNMGLAYQSIGKDAEAMRAFTETCIRAQAEGNLTLAIFALSKLASLQQLHGQLHDAVQTGQWLIRLATPTLPLAAPGYVILGQVCYEWNQLEAAANYLQRAIELSRGNDIESYLVLALVHQVQGNTTNAHEMIHNARHAVDASHHTPLRTRVGAYEARLWLAQADVTRAGYWMLESGLRADSDLNETLDTEFLTLARILIARQSMDEALRLLDRMLTAAESAGRTGRIIEIEMLRSMALDQTAPLERALTLAQPEGYLRLFVENGLKPLLTQIVAGTSPVKDYAAKILALY